MGVRAGDPADSLIQMPPVSTEGGGMVSGEDRETKAAQWLHRLREAAALKESLVDYCRHGFKPGEAYQWKRNLRSAGRWLESIWMCPMRTFAVH